MEEKVGTKAKQILPMLSTATANIPHKALFPLHLQLIQKKSGLREFHFHWKKWSYSTSERVPLIIILEVSHFPKKRNQEHGCPSLLANKGLRQSKVKTQRIGVRGKNLSSGLQMAKRLIQDVPNLCSPFFSLKEVVPVSPKLGGGELFYQAPGQRERGRA